MRFALLGNHPDGLDMARRLVETGRHELIAYSGPTGGVEALRRRGVTVAQAVGDMEEILADPAVEAVLVAGRVADRSVQLRRALQSERHVLCAHPADQTPDVAHEAAMIQADTKQVLLPLLPAALHPLIQRLSELGLGVPRLVELERWSPDPMLIDTDPARHRAALPDWGLLRAVGGEIAEVSAYAAREELSSAEPLFLAGRFEIGGLFRISYVPGQSETRWQLRVVGNSGWAELTFPDGWMGASRLCWLDAGDRVHEENEGPWDPWASLIPVFEAAVERRPVTVSVPLTRPGPPSGAITAEKPARRGPGAISQTVSWQDEIRALELDAAARRSVEQRRAILLEYQEASEEVGFKGTMTLAGCGVLWAIFFLLILSVWMPRLGWLIAPLLVGFLLLQLFRWIIPRQKQE